MNDIMGIDQTGPGPNDPACEEREGSETEGFDRSAAGVGSRSFVGPLSVLLAMVGSELQGYANGTVDAFFVALLLFIAGVLVVGLLFSGRRPEMRAFMLTYGVCVFAGGLAQCYSLAVFHNPQSTIDAPTFYNELAASPPFTTMADIHPNFNARLAILIWQQVYAVTWWLGFKFGPYTAVMFNALVVGLSGALTVRTARELFGRDAWRLRRVGTLFAWCGMFWLFGAVLIRDCYTLFLNTLVLWGLVRWLCRPRLRRLFLALAITGVCYWAMWYLRQKAVVLLGLFGLLAFFCWYWRERMNLIRLFAVALVLLILLFGYVYVEQYMRTSLGHQALYTGIYEGKAVDFSKEDSLAVRLIVNQPMPVRLVTGTASLMVFPLPLWAYLHEGTLDYHLFKTCHGFYQVLIMPLLLVGFLTSLRRSRRDFRRAIPFLFLLLYSMLNLVAVVATTLEMRHLAQFLPAFLILAAVPDTREKKSRLDVRRMVMLWCSVVVGVHLLWWMARL